MSGSEISLSPYVLYQECPSFRPFYVRHPGHDRRQFSRFCISFLDNHTKFIVNIRVLRCLDSPLLCETNPSTYVSSMPLNMHETYDTWLDRVRAALNSINMPMDDWQQSWPFDFSPHI